MKRVHQALACVVTFVLLLLVVEGGLRLMGFSPRPTMNRFDPELGWTKTPNASIRRRTGEFDVLLETNSRGMREPEERGYARTEGRARILLVGDSFTLGYTVDRSETISALLEARLRSEGREVEVFNAGTEGYSTDQEVLWLAREGVRYRPDVVILQMYENDIYWNASDRYLHYPKPRFERDALRAPLGGVPLVDPGLDPWWVRKTALGSLLGSRSAGAMPMLPGPKSLPAEWGPRLSEDGPGWAETDAALRVFAAEVAAMGAKSLVLVIPDKAHIDPEAAAAMTRALGDARYDPKRPARRMLASASRAGLAVVDPAPTLEAAHGRAGQALYFERDWHTNGNGNRVLAAELAEALAAPNLLGPPPRRAVDTGATAPATVGFGWGPWIALAAWGLLGTLFLRRFPDQGPALAFGGVGGLVGLVVGIFLALDWLTGLLPLRMQSWVAPIAVSGLLVVCLWYLRRRLGVMAELFGTFVRRGHWYVLPVLAGLLSIGGLLVVAASSPWLAPFIYTLF